MAKRKNKEDEVIAVVGLVAVAGLGAYLWYRHTHPAGTVVVGPITQLNTSIPPAGA
jgi:hypothetical protein